MTAPFLHDLVGKAVLVTGASGFIGSALCSEIARGGAEVHATSRRPLTEPGILWRACDLADYDATLRLFHAVQPQVVLHLASHVAGTRSVDAVRRTLRANLVGTVNMLMAAQVVGCERVVLAGSLEEPDPGGDFSVPSSPYAAAKHAASAYGRMFNDLYELPVTMLRVAMVYGPGQRDTKKLVPHVITSLLRDELPRLSSGTRAADWVYVDDVVSAITCAATTPDSAGLTLDVGTGTLATVREVVEEIFRMMRPGLTPQFGRLADRALEQDRVANVEQTLRHMNWRPNVPLEEGLRRTVAWFGERNRADDEG